MDSFGGLVKFLKKSNYVENQTGRREEPGTVNGPGERYKVRIFGYHEIECGQPELPDADLPWGLPSCIQLLLVVAAVQQVSLLI